MHCRQALFDGTAKVSAGLFGLDQVVQHLVEFALEGRDLIGSEVQIPFTEVAAHLLGDFADFLFEGLPLLGQAGLDDALVMVLR